MIRGRLRTFLVPTAIALLVVAGTVFVVKEPWSGPFIARREGIRKLAGANSSARLREAAAPLGVVFVLPDRSWIAIHYDDSHSIFSSWSQAVALDSDGRWYESKVHFCGYFSGAEIDSPSRRKFGSGPLVLHGVSVAW